MTVAASAAGTESRTYTIAEASEHTGLSAHTLRYYERIGLLSVSRNQAGQRRYGPADVKRLVFISRLRSTHMPIREICRYFQLVAAGPRTEPERLALLEDHRKQVQRRLTELQSALVAIEFKITVYGDPDTPGPFDPSTSPA